MPWQAHMTSPSSHFRVARLWQNLPSAIFGPAFHSPNPSPIDRVMACLEAYCEYFEGLPWWLQGHQWWLSSGWSKSVKSGQNGLQNLAKSERYTCKRHNFGYTNWSEVLQSCGPNTLKVFYRTVNSVGPSKVGQQASDLTHCPNCHATNPPA